jgi:hypothetical protein
MELTLVTMEYGMMRWKRLNSNRTNAMFSLLRLAPRLKLGSQTWMYQTVNKSCAHSWLSFWSWNFFWLSKNFLRLFLSFKIYIASTTSIWRNFIFQGTRKKIKSAEKTIGSGQIWWVGWAHQTNLMGRSGTPNKSISIFGLK